MYTTFWLQFWPIYRPIISVKSADYRYRPILIFFLIGRSLLLRDSGSDIAENSSLPERYKL